MVMFRTSQILHLKPTLYAKLSKIKVFHVAFHDIVRINIITVCDLLFPSVETKY